MPMRSSQPRCSVRKGVPKNFIKFTGKYVCLSHFLNKVVGLEHFFYRTPLDNCFYTMTVSVSAEKTYSGPCQTFKMERFAKIVDG